MLNDGVDTTECTGGSGFYADFYANEEVSVSAGGGDVEMNTPGAAVVSTIKSGGNTFKGLENFTYEPRAGSATTSTPLPRTWASRDSRTWNSGKATSTSAVRS